MVKIVANLDLPGALLSPLTPRRPQPARDLRTQVGISSIQRGRSCSYYGGRGLVLDGTGLLPGPAWAPRPQVSSCTYTEAWAVAPYGPHSGCTCRSRSRMQTVDTGPTHLLPRPTVGSCFTHTPLGCGPGDITGAVVARPDPCPRANIEQTGGRNGANRAAGKPGRSRVCPGQGWWVAWDSNPQPTD